MNFKEINSKDIRSFIIKNRYLLITISILITAVIAIMLILCLTQNAAKPKINLVAKNKPKKETPSATETTEKQTEKEVGDCKEKDEKADSNKQESKKTNTNTTDDNDHTTKQNENENKIKHTTNTIIEDTMKKENDINTPNTGEETKFSDDAYAEQPRSQSKKDKNLSLIAQRNKELKKKAETLARTLDNSAATTVNSDNKTTNTDENNNFKTEDINMNDENQKQSNEEICKKLANEIFENACEIIFAKNNNDTPKDRKEKENITSEKPDLNELAKKLASQAIKNAQEILAKEANNDTPKKKKTKDEILSKLVQNSLEIIRKDRKVSNFSSNNTTPMDNISPTDPNPVAVDDLKNLPQIHGFIPAAVLLDRSEKVDKNKNAEPVKSA